VYLDNAPDNEVGGGGSTRNLISGNGQNGVKISGTNAADNWVNGNYIGTDASGTADLGNTQHGVYIEDAADNRIGSSSGNRIAYNGDVGVLVKSGTKNLIWYNSIFSNTGLGIDLGEDGVTANDAGDPDTGANNLQNFPVLTSAVPQSGATTIQGSLNSSAEKGFHFEFFSNSACDPSNYGEGETYLGFLYKSTEADGNVSFTFNSPAVVPVGQFVTATAWGEHGSSEFSQCIEVVNPGSLQFSSSTYTVNEDGGTATITVSRAGGSGGAVSVDYATADGTATAGSDYAAASDTLNWAGGETADKTFTAPITNDNLVEGDETVNLALSNPTGGAVLGDPNQATLTIQDNDHTLSVTKDGSGGGTVTSDPARINCGGTCSAGFDEGSTVTLTAAPDADSDFAGWSGNCSGADAATTVTMDADKTCTATFNLKPGTINIKKQTDPAGGTGFDFTDNIPGSGNFTLDHGGTKTLANVVPATYTVTEDDPTPGFDLTGLTCVEDGTSNSTADPVSRQATINLDPDEIVTCTFTNTQRGTITIIKDAVPDDPQEFDFTSDLGNFTLDDHENGTNSTSFTDLGPGTHTVTETVPPGDWNLGSIECDDPDGGTTTSLVTATATIDLDAGEYITCTFANTLPVSVTTATGTGAAEFRLDKGVIENLTAVEEATLSPEGKPVLVFPHGFFSFRITGLISCTHETVVVTITLPSAVPVGTEYWKCHDSAWLDVTSLLGDDDGDNVLTLTLTDGGLGDDDGECNGEIVDPGGPGQPPPVPVGGIVVPVNKLGLVAPWMGVVALVAIGGMLLLWARRRT